MPRDIIRVAVGDPTHLSSSIWRYWNERDEIYAANIGGRSTAKLSLHSSGIWRLALLKQPTRSLGLDADPRVLHRWTRPAEFKHGWTQCSDLIIPIVDIKHRFGEVDLAAHQKRITWITPPPPANKVTLTLLLVTSPTMHPSEVMRSTDAVIGSPLRLESGPTAWLVARQEQMRDDEHEYIDSFVQDMKINYNAAPAAPMFASLMMVDQDRMYPVLFEVALGWEHVLRERAAPPGAPLMLGALA